MHAVSTWDHRDPKEFRKAAIKDYERYGCVTIESAVVNSIKKTEQGVFEATDTKGKVYLTRKIILATGVEDIYPEIDGYADCWVSGMLVFSRHPSIFNSH